MIPTHIKRLVNWFQSENFFFHYPAWRKLTQISEEQIKKLHLCESIFDPKTYLYDFSRAFIILMTICLLKNHHMDFPGANAGDMGLIPGPKRFHMAQTKPVHHNY